MKMLSAEELTLFCEQLGMVLRAGITVEEGLSMMKEELEEGEYRSILQQIEEGMDQGQKIIDAFCATGRFPNYMMSMLKIGLEAGKLDEVVSKLEIYYQREVDMKQGIKRILFYPLILLGIMGAVIGVITTQVIPIFEQVLESLGMQMSGSAVSVMHIGTLMAQVSIGVICLLILLAVGMVLVSAIKGKQYIQENFLQHFKFYEQIVIQRMLTALALMVSSGVEIGEAMKLVVPLVEHNQLKTKLEKGIVQLEDGQFFIDVLKELGILSPLSIKRLVIGNRTGCMDEVLEKLAIDHEEQVEKKFESVLMRIEPAVIIILATVVGSLLIAVMFPLMNIVSAIG